MLHYQVYATKMYEYDIAVNANVEHILKLVDEEALKGRFSLIFTFNETVHEKPQLLIRNKLNEIKPNLIISRIVEPFNNFYKCKLEIKW